MDRKVWLPSGGSLVIDRTEAMTVIDVNTGKFVGSGGNLEETVTKNNLEAAEEIVRQLRLRDIGGIIVIDFIDMVLESNRDLVVRRLLECLGRDRTKHQVAEVTSLGLVQMTRKRVGSGLIEVFSEVCEHCNGRGIIVHSEPVDRPNGDAGDGGNGAAASRSRGRRGKGAVADVDVAVKSTGPTPAQIAAAAHAAAIKGLSGESHIDAAAVAGELPEPTTAWAAEAAPEPETESAAAMGTGLAPEPVAGPAADSMVESAAEEVAESAAESAGELAGELGARSGTPAVAQPEIPEPPSGLAFEPTPDEPVMQPVTEPPAPKRRRRGRVVAPAGPPRSLEGASTTQETSVDAPGSEATPEA
jgi:ribonuclease E